MRVEHKLLRPGPMSLEAFAEKHGLVMKVSEREHFTRDLPRYFASFKRVEAKVGGMLSSQYGGGHTPEDAVANYARKIEGHRLVYGAHTSERREFFAPMEFVDD